MFIEPSGSKSFSIDLSSFSIVGFHATSSEAARNIQRVGCLPDKLLSQHELNDLLNLARELSIDTQGMGGFEEWLAMKSVTFTKDFDDALNHVNAGRFKGQGRQHILEILDKAADLTDLPPRLAQIRQALSASPTIHPVIYAVDLSNLGQRLIEPRYNSYYQIFWRPGAPLPSLSIVGPERLIARLDL